MQANSVNLTTEPTAGHKAMPGAALRRLRRTAITGRKRIKCPHCRGLLIHVDRDVIVQTYINQMGKNRKDIPGLTNKRCPVCGKDVGLAIATRD